MEIELPRALARFNRAVTNPVQLRYAWLLLPWAVIVHTGRRSGRVYRTPVIAFRRGRVLAVVILYGEGSDWVRNVLAGGARVVRRGRTYELLAPQLIAPGQAEDVSTAAQLLGGLSGRLLVAELSGPGPGFGPGPSAG